MHPLLVIARSEGSFDPKRRGNLIKKEFMQKVKEFILDKKNTKYFIFAALFILYFWGLGAYGLLDHDEGRYSEIPREMLEKGDFITPTLNYLLYFEKPALHYWQTALSFKIFGLNEFGARFFPSLLGLFGVFFTWLFAKKLYDEDTANLTAVVLGTSILYYTIAHINITDMTVSFYLILSLFAFYFYFTENKKIWAFVFYAAMALAVLTKGLIGIVLPGGVIFWFMIFTRRWDIIKKLLYWPGILLFFIISVPWFYMVNKVNPGFFHFFFIQEHFLRYATKMHNRYEAWWFFIPVILGGLFPWVIGLFLSAKNIISKKHDALFLMLWVVVMLIFFSISSSKLIPYIIPLFPPLLVIIARNIMDMIRQDSKPKYMALATFITVMAAAMAVAAIIIFGGGVQLKRLDGIMLYKDVIYSLIALCVICAVAMWCFVKHKSYGLLIYSVFSFMFLLAAKPGFVTISDERSTWRLMHSMREYVKPQDIIVSYSTYLQDIPFYLQRRIIITGWIGELEYGYDKVSPEERAKWMVADKDIHTLLERPLEPGQKMYFVVRDRYLDKYPFKESTKLIDRAGKYSAYVRES